MLTTALSACHWEEWHLYHAVFIPEIFVVSYVFTLLIRSAQSPLRNLKTHSFLQQGQDHLQKVICSYTTATASQQSLLKACVDAYFSVTGRTVSGSQGSFPAGRACPFAASGFALFERPERCMWLKPTICHCGVCPGSVISASSLALCNFSSLREAFGTLLSRPPGHSHQPFAHAGLSSLFLHLLVGGNYVFQFKSFSHHILLSAVDLRHSDIFLSFRTWVFERFLFFLGVSPFPEGTLALITNEN